MPFEGQINYQGELVAQTTVAGVTTLTIKGKIAQILEEEMVEEASAFVLRNKRSGLSEQINSDRSPALFVNGDPSQGERAYDDEEMEIERVESAEAGSRS